MRGPRRDPAGRGGAALQPSGEHRSPSQVTPQASLNGIRQGKCEIFNRLCDNVVRTLGIRMTTLTIRLDAKLEKALDRIAKSSGRTKSEIAREALRRQVSVARFRELRTKTLRFAEAQGLLTDEDVFRALS